MTERFFVSYAREDATHYLDAFLEQLMDSVRIKSGGARDDVAFVDRSHILVGAEWPKALANALQECAVFVPILTPSYFSREVCGKEWGYFRLRQDQAPAPRPPLVIPVLWGELPDVRDTIRRIAPPDLVELNISGPKFPPEYLEHGLYRLMRQSRFQDVRTEIIDQLARRIWEVSATYALPGLSVVPPLREVPTLFPVASQPSLPTDLGARTGDSFPAGPRWVEFVLVAGARSDLEAKRRNCHAYGGTALEWCPYHPDETAPAGLIANEVASQRRFYSEPVIPDTALSERIKSACQRNRPVVLLVDTWTLHVEPYFELMRDFDKTNYVNTAVVVIWNPKDDETAASRDVLDEIVRKTFFFRAESANSRSLAHVASPDEFRHELGEAIEGTLRRMRDYADVPRAVRRTPRPTL
jgi:FxsC-like protein